MHCFYMHALLVVRFGSWCSTGVTRPWEKDESNVGNRWGRSTPFAQLENCSVTNIALHVCDWLLEEDCPHEAWNCTRCKSQKASKARLHWRNDFQFEMCFQVVHAERTRSGDSKTVSRRHFVKSRPSFLRLYVSQSWICVSPALSVRSNSLVLFDFSRAHLSTEAGVMLPQIFPPRASARLHGVSLSE